MLSLFERFWSEETGQGLTEYALIIALVSVGLVAVMVLFRNSIGGVFANITNTLNGAPNP